MQCVPKKRRRDRYRYTTGDTIDLPTLAIETHRRVPVITSRVYAKQFRRHNLSAVPVALSTQPILREERFVNNCGSRAYNPRSFSLSLSLIHRPSLHASLRLNLIASFVTSFAHPRLRRTNANFWLCIVPTVSRVDLYHPILSICALLSTKTFLSDRFGTWN